MVETVLQTVFQPVGDALRQFAPSIFFAAVVLVVGYILGRITSSVVERLLDHTNVDRYFEEQGHLEIVLTDLFADLAKWVVYFVFIWQAGKILGVEAVNRVLEELVTYIPSVIGAIAVFIAGYGIAVYTKDEIVGSETLYSDILGKIIFLFVIYIAFATALDMARIPTSLLNNILLILVASAGLAFAIAVGWGLKDIVRQEVERYLEESR